MNRRKYWLVLIVLAIFGLSIPVAGSALEVGDKAPDFELPSS
jgi:hypothetical protein